MASAFPHYKPTKTLDDLTVFISISNANANVEEAFKKSLHHFSKRPPFRTKPTSFKKFIEYCSERPTGILAGGENERTIQRIYRYVELLNVKSKHTAISEAWKNFPLLRTLCDPVHFSLSVA